LLVKAGAGDASDSAGFTGGLKKWYIPNGSKKDTKTNVLAFAKLASLPEEVDLRTVKGSEPLLGTLIDFNGNPMKLASERMDLNRRKALAEQMQLRYPREQIVVNYSFDKVSYRARFATHVIGSAKWRSDRGSFVVERTFYDGATVNWPGKVQLYAEFKVQVNGVPVSHIYAHVKWYKEYKAPDDGSNSNDYPLTFSPEFQDDLVADEWIPLHRIYARCCRMFLNDSCFVPCILPFHFHL
jgi:hypothetical protein